jgi:hypothetical protein
MESWIAKNGQLRPFLLRKNRFPVNSFHSCRVIVRGHCRVGTKLVFLPFLRPLNAQILSRMPTPTIFRRPHGLCRGNSRPNTRVLVAVSVVLLAIGCRNTLPAAEPAPREVLFPSLKLDPNLLKSLKPSNTRDWTPEQAVLAYAEIHGSRATVHNIRDCRWRSLDDFTVAHYDKTFDLGKLNSVDFIVVPFNESPRLGHTMLSFGFDGEDYLAVSVEIRRERGEAFDAVKGFFQQYEIIYILADERDVIQRRVNCDLCDVYVYRSTATPKQARELFIDVMRRVNKLVKEPEFYDTLTNNCTTNIRNHINHLKPNEVPYDYRVLLPGYSDRLAYDLGLIERHGSYEETRLHARVNYEAYLYREDPAFSRKIRR